MMKSLHRDTRWPFDMISILDWRILSLWLALCCMYGLSYKVLELLDQRIVLVRQIAGVDPERRRQSC
jgi:hypothetical protein